MKTLRVSVGLGLGNNSASLLAAIALIPTVFAVRPQQALEIVQQSGPASTGMTFIYFPKLLEEVPGGAVIMPLFFLGLTFAAISSMISMFELGTRNICDYGIERKKAIGIIYAVALLLGIPSALSLKFLTNQDWVWGLGLMVSGFLFATAARQIGSREFREEFRFEEVSHVVPMRHGFRYGKIVSTAIEHKAVLEPLEQLQSGDRTGPVAGGHRALSDS